LKAYTPVIEQYLDIKKQHEDAVLFFRLGDFYEMFFDDAQTAARELEIVLTARDGGGDKKIPMCGVPYHAAGGYIAKLIAAGYRVAICEQQEDSHSVKGLVRREVTRVITPGTVLDDNMLDDNRNSYLAAVIVNSGIIGLAYTDVSTGEFKIQEFTGAKAEFLLKEELERLSPAECLVTEWSSAPSLWQDMTAVGGKTLISRPQLPFISEDEAAQILRDTFKTDSQGKQGLKDYTCGLVAAALIISFLKKTQKSEWQHLRYPVPVSGSAFMEIDYSTRRNLELTANLREQKKEGTLLSILDGCSTAMGKRLLRNWLERPLKELNPIKKRQDAVEELFENITLRQRLGKLLPGFYDLERLSGRLGSHTATPRDLLAVKQSLGVLPELRDAVSSVKSDLLVKYKDLDTVTELFQLIDGAVADEAPLSVKEGDIIKDGYHEGIDELRKISREGSQWLVNFELREKQRTGIKSLKIGYNRVFGYYVEVSRGSAADIPHDYHRKQTLANNERYINEELKGYEDKILGAKEKLHALEHKIFLDLCTQAAGYISRLQAAAAMIAKLDVFYALAEIAFRNDYTRPRMTNDPVLEIKDGRHPVVEKTLQNISFVPNDLFMDEEDYLFGIITGPNMGGKSTFMRQTALIIIMAQIGGFVPVKQARVGIVDRVFTRIGAADDLAAGQSTFMVEMMEVANILNNATKKSFIILDEIGRGTSTYDGLSVARAVSEFIVDHLKAKTLFATHYHELTELSQSKYGIFNLSVSVKETEDEVIFLKKVLSGQADKSYGIYVARLAGIPLRVINRAQEILDMLEPLRGSQKKPALFQPLLFANDSSSDILDELKEINLDDVSPKKAWDILWRWQLSVTKDN
jgi:DNA mismatch repair protein MutS